MSKAKKDMLRAWYAKNAKSNFEKSLMKSTYPNDEDCPKEKHVGLVVMTLQGQDYQCPLENAVYIISQRFSNPLWAQVLKTSFILHRALDQIGKNLAVKVSQMKNPMIKNFSDPSEKGMFHSDLVREYYNYLIQKAEYYMNRHCIYSSKDKQSYFAKADNGILSEQIDLLVKLQVQIMTTCKALEKAIKTFKFPITQGVATLIIKDTVGNYQICQEAFTIIIGKSQYLDRFFQMQKDQAQICLEACKLFQTLSKPMKQTQELTRHIASSQKFPKIKDVPPEVLANMERYVFEDSDPLQFLSSEEIEMQKKMLKEFEKKKEEEEVQYKENDMLEFVEEVVPKQQFQQQQFEQPKQNAPKQLQQQQQEQPKQSVGVADFDFFSETQQPQQPQLPQQGLGFDLMPTGQQPQQQVSKTDLILNQFNQPPQQPQVNNLAQFSTMQPGMMGMGFQNQQNFSTANPQMMQMMQMFQTMQQMQGANNPQNMAYQQFMTNQNRGGPMQFNTGMPQNMGTGFQMPAMSGMQVNPGMQGSMGGMPGMQGNMGGMPGMQGNMGGMPGMQSNAFGQQNQKNQPVQFQSQAQSGQQFSQSKVDNKKADNPFDSFF